jgi:hypothetical protein
MAFFLFSGPDPHRALVSVCRRPAATRQGKARLERTCGIPNGPSCGTLLLYLP